MPIHRWAFSNPDFRDMYRRAQLIKADVFADEVVAISGDSRNDWLERLNRRTGKTELVPNRELLQRTELRINARKWAASKLNPKKYGEKAHAGDPDNPVEVNPQATAHERLVTIENWLVKKPWQKSKGPPVGPLCRESSNEKLEFDCKTNTHLVRGQISLGVT